MYGVYVIPEKYRDKDIELEVRAYPDPLNAHSSINEKRILHIPLNSFYVDIIPVTIDGREIGDDYEGEPLLRYFDKNENLIGIEDSLLDCDMQSLDRRLELIFERKE